MYSRTWNCYIWLEKDSPKKISIISLYKIASLIFRHSAGRNIKVTFGYTCYENIDEEKLPKRTYNLKKYNEFWMLRFVLTSKYLICIDTIELMFDYICCWADKKNINFHTQCIKGRKQDINKLLKKENYWFLNQEDFMNKTEFFQL